MKIIIIIDLEVILEKCDLIGTPKHYSVAKPSVPGQPMNQPAVTGGNPPYYGPDSAINSSASRPTMVGGDQVQPSGVDYNASSHSYGSSFSGNMNSGRYNPSNASPIIMPAPLIPHIINPLRTMQQRANS